MGFVAHVLVVVLRLPVDARRVLNAWRCLASSARTRINSARLRLTETFFFSWADHKLVICAVNFVSGSETWRWLNRRRRRAMLPYGP